uniref:asparagine synthase (glutamine-hydrolyzing) n=1 Tax=viral metagenome TaxID=1070528 RepID=A0A6C0B828_9ZZZZ
MNDRNKYKDIGIIFVVNMCGIFAILNNDMPLDFIQKQFEKGSGRGPEHSVYKNIMIKADYGFHRLAINGLNDESNQPIIIDNIALICNGEIYNYRELYEEINIEPETDSDCEVIIHLYLKYGIEHTLQLLDGVFSFILTDYRSYNESAKMYVARDPYGVRPLYLLQSSEKNKVVAFASELKQLSEICSSLNKKMRRNESSMSIDNESIKDKYKVSQFVPGSYSVYELAITVMAKWNATKEFVSYHSTGFSSTIYNSVYDPTTIASQIQFYFINAIRKRCSTTERPIACLLSGGLDSSLVAALVNEFHIENGLPKLETYSIGLVGSEDLEKARIVANYLGTVHNEIILTEDDFLNAIPNVIEAIESYDTTSVRASIGNWLLGKYISENSQAKVIFNGDGSDELCGGYLYMHKTPDNFEFDKECRRLLKDIYLFDVLRSDKSISSHGLEPRTPFLDRAWTQFYLSIPAGIRNHKMNGQCEKFLLRNAFCAENYLNSQGLPLLPSEILWRRKEAFSDGVSEHSRSLYQIIQEHCTHKFKEEDYRVYDALVYNEEDIVESVSRLNQKMFEINEHLIPKTTEQYYYRKLFEEFYQGMSHIVPYFWMPKYVDAKDASARTLELYNDEN